QRPTGADAPTAAAANEAEGRAGSHIAREIAITHRPFADANAATRPAGWASRVWRLNAIADKGTIAHRHRASENAAARVVGKIAEESAIAHRKRSAWVINAAASDVVAVGRIVVERTIAHCKRRTDRG